MSKKTISTSTLSLRFMQNARRAQNLAHVELDKAEVHDDGKWEVNEEVKQAWGLTVVPVCVSRLFLSLIRQPNVRSSSVEKKIVAGP